MPEALQLLGDYGAELELGFAEIVQDFGDGYDRNVLVGNSAGQRSFRLVYRLGCRTLTDPETSDVVTESQYVWRFFKRRKQDGAAFNITIYDPETETDTAVLVKFAESNITYTMLSARLFSTGLRLRQHRAA